MYNFKLPRNNDHTSESNDPFKTEFLRIWIVTGGTFLVLLSIFEVGGNFRSSSTGLLAIIFFIAILYLTDVFAESYKVMRYAFITVSIILGMTSVGLAINFAMLSMFMGFVYCLVAALLAFHEYEL